MDYFSYIIKCILRKIPLKLLLIIAIFLILSGIFFYSKSFAYSGQYFEFDNIQFEYYLPDKVIDTFCSLEEYGNVNYDWYIYMTSASSDRDDNCIVLFIDKSRNIKFYNDFNSNNPFSVSNGCHIRSNTSFNCIQYYFKYNANTDTCSTPSKNSNKSYGGGFNSFVFYTLASDSPTGANRIWWLCGTDIYNTNQFNTIFSNASYLPTTYQAPYIVNSTGLTNWSFDNLYISLGSETWDYTEDGIGYQPTSWSLNINYMGNTYYKDLSKYLYEQEGIEELVFKFPRNILSNQFNIYNGQEISLSLTQYNKLGNNIRTKTFTLDTWVLNLTAQEQSDVNSDSDKQLMGSIDSGISNLSDSIDNFYNSFNNTSVTPQLVNELFDTGEDITINDSSGIENFFLILYNAFCENQVVNVHVTIPFTNKTMTISSMEVSNHYPSALISIMSIVSYGAICLFICRDIRKMVDKSLEGNVENISHDIKREVL